MAWFTLDWYVHISGWLTVSPPVSLEGVVGEEFSGPVVTGEHAGVGVAGGAGDQSVGDAVFGGLGDNPRAQEVRAVVGWVLEWAAGPLLDPRALLRARKMRNPVT